VCINLCCRKAGMTEEFLYGIEIGPPVKHVCGESMP
jgi:hypothetical protein